MYIKRGKGKEVCITFHLYVIHDGLILNKGIPGKYEEQRAHQGSFYRCGKHIILGIVDHVLFHEKSFQIQTHGI